MPDLHALLADEAARLEPAEVPSFDGVRQRARRHRRNRAAGAVTTGVAVCTVLALAVVGLLRPEPGSTAATTPGAFRVYSDDLYNGDVLTFRYPDAWNAYATDGFLVDGQHGDGSLVKLSNEDAPFPCALLTDGRWRVSCDPGRRLSQGSVFIRWGSSLSRRSSPLAPGRPLSTLDAGSGSPREIGGHPATLSYRSPDAGLCELVGATKQLSVTILVGEGSDAFQLTMTACLAAPYETTEQQVLDVLDTVAITD